MGADENASYDDSLEEDAVSGPLQVVKLFEAYRYKATRTAMFKPLLPFDQRQDNAAAYTAVRCMYRDRITQLALYDWPYEGARKKLTYMRNCPPPGCLLPRKTRCCNKPNVCPFCWGRQRVLFPFRKLETVLYGATGPYQSGGKLLPLVRPDLKIVRFTSPTSGSAEVTKEYPLDPDRGIEHHWAYVRERLNVRRRWEFLALGAEYGVVVLKIFPMVKENRLGVIRCGVLLVPEDRTPDVQQRLDHAEAGGRLEVYEPSKQNLATAMGRALTFPARMLRADPHVTARLLTLMHKTRVLSWYGGNPKTTIEE